MRTSKDVLHRLQHDPNMKSISASTLVAFVDRFVGPIELPLRRFVTSEVPLHRILYFRHASKVLWHRDTRLDTIFETSDENKAFSVTSIEQRRKDVQMAMENRRKREEDRLCTMRASRDAMRPVCIHHYSEDAGTWVASPSCSANGDHNEENVNMSVMTFNVLHDIFLDDDVKMLKDQRWKEISNFITKCKAHIIVLTEVTRQFASMLSSLPEVQNTFALSDSIASNFDTLPEESNPFATGQLILIPKHFAVSAVHVSQPIAGSPKSLVFVSFSKAQFDFTLCGLHLTAGRAVSEEEEVALQLRRKTQLGQALGALKSIRGAWILAGDFNIKTKHEEFSLRELMPGFKEANHDLLMNTFDPVKNELAALSSMDGIPKRLDRIYVSCGNLRSEIKFEDHKLFFANPIIHSVDDGNLIHASDHFGIETTFSISKQAVSSNDGDLKYFVNINAKPEWSKASAIAFVPSKESQETIDRVWRQHYDPMHRKWPPHVNVIYPFVHPSVLSDVSNVIRHALILHEATSFSSSSNLKMRMKDSVGHFKHRKSNTAFLQPIEETNILEETRNLLYEECVQFIGSKEQDSRDQYTPHLTIGKLKKPEDINAFCEKASEQLKELQNNDYLKKAEEFSSLSVLQRIDGIMTVVDELEIVSSKSISKFERTTQLIQAMAEKLFNSKGIQVNIRVVGSAGILLDETETDVDVIIEGVEKTLSINDLSSRIQEILPKPIIVRDIESNGCDIIHIDLKQPEKYLPVDILWGKEEEETNAIQAMQKIKEISDSDVRFLPALINVKNWAREVQLTGRSFSLFGGIAWSIMLACVAAEFPHSSDLENEFFKFFSFFKWDHFEVTVDGKQPKPKPIRKNAVVSIRIPSSDTNFTSGLGQAVLSSFSRLCKTSISSTNYEAVRKREWEVHFSSILKIVIQIEITEQNNVYGTEYAAEQITGWLKSKFKLFDKIWLNDDGLQIRPSGNVEWQIKNSHKIGILSSGIDQTLSVDKSQWNHITSTAETRLRDEFLRWEQRPSNCSIAVQVS